MMGVVINAAVVPITLSMVWDKLTGLAMIVGSISGTIIALILWIGLSACYPGGLADFKTNSTREIPSLIGNVASLLSGGIITVMVTLLTSQRTDKSEIWEETRDIDNPLSPWTELYAKELHLTGTYALDDRPSLKDVHKAFRGAKITALIGSLVLTLIIVVIWPSIMVAVSVMSQTSFSQWVTLSKIWAFAATIFIIVVPFTGEIVDIYITYRDNLKVQPEPGTSRGDTSIEQGASQEEEGSEPIQSVGKNESSNNAYIRKPSLDTIMTSVQLMRLSSYTQMKTN